MKKCPCGETDLEKFCRNSAKPNGIDTYCRQCRRNQAMAYRLRHPERIKATNQRPEVKAMKMAYKKTARGRASEKRYEQSVRGRSNRSWRLRCNPENGRARRAMYKAAQILRTPAWLNSEQHKEIRQFYIDAVYLTYYTRVKFEVDHILPLRGENVSGLHVPWNLQLLTKKENREKQHKVVL